jgi:hypothetical protein
LESIIDRFLELLPAPDVSSRRLHGRVIEKKLNLFKFAETARHWEFPSANRRVLARLLRTQFPYFSANTAVARASRLSIFSSSLDSEVLSSICPTPGSCERNAVAGNPVDGVKRPMANNNEGSTPALGDAQARRLLEAPARTR